MNQPVSVPASTLISVPISVSMSPPDPPRKPEPHECCGTGCIPCVMDIYEEELWQYEKDLKAWEAANTASQADATGATTSDTTSITTAITGSAT